MIEEVTLATWDRRKAFEEFTRRTEVLRDLVGTLYPSIVRAELEQIAAYSIRAFGYHPNWVPELEKRERVERAVNAFAALLAVSKEADRHLHGDAGRTPGACCSEVCRLLDRLDAEHPGWRDWV